MTIKNTVSAAYVSKSFNKEEFRKELVALYNKYNPNLSVSRGVTVLASRDSYDGLYKLINYLGGNMPLAEIFTIVHKLHYLAKTGWGIAFNKELAELLQTHGSQLKHQLENEGQQIDLNSNNKYKIEPKNDESFNIKEFYNELVKLYNQHNPNKDLRTGCFSLFMPLTEDNDADCLGLIKELKVIQDQKGDMIDKNKILDVTAGLYNRVKYDMNVEFNRDLATLLETHGGRLKYELNAEKDIKAAYFENNNSNGQSYSLFNNNGNSGGVGIEFKPFS